MPSSCPGLDVDVVPIGKSRIEVVSDEFRSGDDPRPKRLVDQVSAPLINILNALIGLK